MSGHLYQLWSNRHQSSGEYYRVDGPWDKHGLVVKFIRQTSEGYLHLIRGTGFDRRGKNVFR